MNVSGTYGQDNDGTQRISAQVRPEQAGMRLDAYWSWKLADQEVSRNRIRELIKSSQAQVNDQICTKPAAGVQAGDRLILALPPLQAVIRPQAGSVHILWQDGDLAVVNKPPGMSVHPASSEQGETLVHRLVHLFPHLASQDDLRPGIVHRLDKNTSGLLLVALNEKTRKALSRSLSSREVEKDYLALVHGCPKRDQAWIDLPLARDERRKTRMAVHTGHGRRAQTWYKILHTFEHVPCSLLQVRIITGRTHQIRVHLAHMGHAVLGDLTYGPQQEAQLARTRPELAREAKRQMLHAWRLGLHHPWTQEWHNHQHRIPKDFLRVLLRAERRPQRVGITGSAGCGKSALTSLLAGDNFPVWSADKAVAELYAPWADGWEMLRRSFGSRFVPDDSGPVDKKALFAAMQSSAADRKAILDLIHPLVEQSWKEFCKHHDQSRMILAEVPLLLEGGWKEKGLVDVAVNVLCPDSVRRQRLAANRGWDPDMIEQMQAWQMPDAQKAVLAEINVSNAGSWSQLEQEARELHQSLLVRRRQKVHDFMSWLQTRGVI